MLCLEVLDNGTLKQAKLRRYLEQKYVKYVDENLELSKEKRTGNVKSYLSSIYFWSKNLLP